LTVLIATHDARDACHVVECLGCGETLLTVTDEALARDDNPANLLQPPPHTCPALKEPPP
jgi:hypothetical protein